MSTLITAVHVITCVLLILVVMIQSGKGADISASLGGSSQTVFGSSGGANFFTRFTGGAATIFMITSLVLTLLKDHGRKSVFENAPPTPPAQTTTAPGTQPAAPGQTTPAKAAPAAPAAAAPPNNTTQNKTQK